MITELMMLMITKDDAKIQNYDKKEEYFSRNLENFSRILKLYSLARILQTRYILIFHVKFN